MDITQEQLNEQIAKAVAEATKGLFTEEDLNKRVTSEVDRRVESGIKKGIETQRQKIEDEIRAEVERKAKMTAEELAKEQLALAESELAAREQEINRRANRLNAMDILAEKGVKKDAYEDILDTLVFDDSEKTTEAVTKFASVLDNMRSEIETKVRTEQTRVPAPNVGDGDKPVTADSFKKMSYADKLKFKAESPELYQQFMTQ